MFADQLAGKEIALGKMRGLATREGMETIAQRLARLRKERGITQEEMAHLLGISQPIVSDYERGELRLHGELIVKLVKILGVTADEILGLESSRNNNTLKSRRFLRRIQQIEKLSKRDQEAVLRTIDAFLAKSS
jgi:transcriptional regulator with XRE-family HTH domain